MSWFLRAHAVPGLETFDDGQYRRALACTNGPAVIDVELGDHGAAVTITRHGGSQRDTDKSSEDLTDALVAVRSLLAADVDTTAADRALAEDPDLAAVIASAPGLPVPGALDATEVVIRTMIGQQISMAAAATHTARLVAKLGEPVAGTDLRLFPSAAAIAEHGADILTGPARRVQSIAGAAAALADGALNPAAHRCAAELEADLLTLPGVGPWTARYTSLRVMRDPDVLLDTDLVVRQGAAVLGLDLRDSQRWSPFRSTVSMHLWRIALADRQARAPGGHRQG